MKGVKKGFYGWIALGAASLSLFFSAGSNYTFSAFLPALNNQFGWPVGEISIAMTLLMGLVTLFAPVAGFFVARFGTRASITIGNLLIAAGFLMLAFHGKQWQLYMGYTILGIGGGLCGIVACGTVASNWFIKKAPLAMGINVSAQGVGGLVLAPLSAMLIQAAGWRLTYMVLSGLLLLFGAILPGFIIRNKPENLGQVPDGVASPDDPHESDDPSHIQGTPVDFTFKQAMGTSAFWILCLYACMPLFIMIFLMAHQINFLTKGIGLSNETAGLAMGLVSGAMVLGTLGMGVLALKIDVKRLTLVATSLILLSMALAFMTRSAPLAFTYSILFGIGLGSAMVSFMSLTSAYFGRTAFSKILGMSMLFTLLSTLGAPVGGYIYEATNSYELAFIVGITGSLISFILILLLRPPVHPSMKAMKHDV